MDRDDSDNGSPKELSSFDVAKMTEAEVAAEIAQRMTRWRRARNRADRAEGAPPADRPAAPQTLTGQAGAAVKPATPALVGPAAGALSDTAGERMERALRLAARKAARRLPVIDAPAESPEVAAQPEPQNRGEQAAPHPHATARSARRVLAPWAVIAAAVVAASALTVWIFLPLGQAPPPQVAPRAEAPPADAGALAVRTPAPEARAPQQAPPATAPLQTPLAALSSLPARIKPASKLPTLAARLKPDGTAATKPSPAPAAQPESAPLPSASQAPPPRTEPQYKPAPPAARGTGKDDDLNDMFEMMFSDGVGQ